MPGPETLRGGYSQIYQFNSGGSPQTITAPRDPATGVASFISANGLNGFVSRAAVGVDTPFAAGSVSVRQTDVSGGGVTYAGVSSQGSGRNAYYFGINDDFGGQNPVDVLLNSFVAISAGAEGAFQAYGLATLQITGGGIQFDDYFSYGASGVDHYAAGCEDLHDGCVLLPKGEGISRVTSLQSVAPGGYDPDTGEELPPITEYLSVVGDYRDSATANFSSSHTLSLLTNTVYRVELVAGGAVDDVLYYENGWSLPGVPNGSRRAGSGFANAYIDPMFTIDPLFLESNPGLSIQLTENYGNAVGDADTIPEGFTGRGIAPIGGGGTVPEPATWALMILGFGAAGAMLRRPRRAIA